MKPRALQYLATRASTFLLTAGWSVITKREAQRMESRFRYEATTVQGSSSEEEGGLG